MHDKRTRAMTRRDVLRIIGIGGVATLAAACSPAAPAATPTTAPKPATSAPASHVASPAAAASPAASPAAATSGQTAARSTAAISEAEWNAVVAAAKTEGKFAIATYAGGGYRKVVEAFQSAYPDIVVEQTQFQSSSRDFTPRLLTELKAGLHTWDVAIMPPQEQLRQTRPAGGLDPIRPMIVRADVLNDAAWVDGYEKSYPDIEKRWGFTLTLSKTQPLWINTDLVADGEIKTIQDMLNPKWKGKIIAADPRTRGSAFSPSLVMRVKTGGDDIIRQLFKDQEPQLTVDARQPTELMARGRFALAFGAVDRHILADFREQGLGNNVKPLSLADLDYTGYSFNALWLLKDAQHPNAAKVFINWALGKEAGGLWAENLEDNSRRADVPVFDKEIAITPGVEYINPQDEQWLEETDKTQRIAQSVLN